MSKLSAAFNIEELRGAVREALECRDQAMAFVHRSLQAVVRAGALLNKAKGELEHGEFITWVEDNVQEITHATATRWMKLALFAETHGEQLDEAATVRQAYILAGILPEPESSSGGGGAASGGDAYLTYLVRSATHISARLSQKPITDWPAEDRRILRDRLAPLVRIYEQLTAA
ncbi:MAG: DUF3102 domain-containing protein [Chthoniobacteraceae bacterium]